MRRPTKKSFPTPSPGPYDHYQQSHNLNTSPSLPSLHTHTHKHTLTASVSLVPHPTYIPPPMPQLFNPESAICYCLKYVLSFLSVIPFSSNELILFTYHCCGWFSDTGTRRCVSAEPSRMLFVTNTLKYMRN